MIIRFGITVRGFVPRRYLSELVENSDFRKYDDGLRMVVDCAPELADALEQWHAMVLLVIHGLAGVLWQPASQLIVHDIVGHKELQSAVRLTTSSRMLGLLLGLQPGLTLVVLRLLGLQGGQGVDLAGLLLPALAGLGQFGARHRIVEFDQGTGQTVTDCTSLTAICPVKLPWPA